MSDLIALLKAGEWNDAEFKAARRAAPIFYIAINYVGIKDEPP
jgi:hypothetical protein